MWFSSAGTSGDTGGSAIQSAKGLCGVDVVVVYPRGRISPVQEKQMTTCLEDNIHVFAGEGLRGSDINSSRTKSGVFFSSNY